MPTYDYRCRDCGHDFEVQQAFSDDPLTTCPRCEGELRKVFSPVGISFKGSGFYKTDSRGGSSRSSTSGDTTSTTSDGGSDTSTSSGSTDGGSSTSTSTSGDSSPASTTTPSTSSPAA